MRTTIHCVGFAAVIAMASSIQAQTPTCVKSINGGGFGFGTSIAIAGDMNGDQLAEILVGSWQYPSNVAHGKVEIFDAAGGPTITYMPTTAQNANFGRTLASGDVGGDGDFDVFIGAPREGGLHNGTVRTYLAPASVGQAPSNTYTGGAGIGGELAGVGDFDGDGNADYATVDQWPITNRVRVISATGVELFVHNEARRVGYYGDFDGDTYEDVVLVSAYAGTPEAIEIWAFGPGRATPAMVFSETIGPTFNGAIAIAGAGDVNGGKPDVVVSWSRFETTGLGEVRMYSPDNAPGQRLLWNVTGAHASLFWGEHIAAGRDVTGDGVPDVLVGSEKFDDPTNGTDAGKVVLYSGDDGSIHQGFPWIGAPSQRLGHAVAMGDDINGDGMDDFLVGALESNNLGSVCGYAYDPPLPDTAPRDIAIYDADGDEDYDVVTADSGSDTVSIELNDGTGTMAEPIRVPVPGSAPFAVAVGELNSAGDYNDLVVACADSDTVVVLHTIDLVTPSNTQSIVIPAGGSRPVHVAIGNFENNAVDDIVVAREGLPISLGGGVAVILNAGPPWTPALTATEVATPKGSAARIVKVAACDLDGDGDDDIAALSHGFNDEILLIENVGYYSGTFAFADAIPLSTSGLANGLCCDDVDGDGDVDLAVGLPTLFPTPISRVQIFRYVGSGTLTVSDYTASPAVVTGGAFSVDIACGDLEDNGVPGVFARDDMAVVFAGGTVPFEVQHDFDVSVEAFGSTSGPTVGTQPIAVTIGDLNGDGADDMAVANHGSHDTTIILSTVPALTDSFGLGCPGSGPLNNGIPFIAGVGTPSPGTVGFGVQVSNAAIFAPALMMFSASPAVIPLPPSSCTIYLGAPAATVLRFTDGTGQHTYFFDVPATPGIEGADVFFQWAVFDALGEFGPGLLAMTAGLRVQVGS